MGRVAAEGPSSDPFPPSTQPPGLWLSVSLSGSPTVCKPPEDRDLSDPSLGLRARPDRHTGGFLQSCHFCFIRVGR